MAKRNRTKRFHNINLPIKTITIGRKTIRLIADRVLIFRLMRRLHGRFWGVAGLVIMFLGIAVCFLIEPGMQHWSTAFSDFGRSVRTAPYLAASLFFGAYGLWRWRDYLRRTLKRARPVTSLVTLTVIGLYVAALMPVAWEPWPYRIHMFGVTLAGISAAATVVADTLLTRAKRKKNMFVWRFLRLSSFLFIIIGGHITLGSASPVGWYRLALPGELMMLAGYGIWIIDKTYRGEGGRSRLSLLLGRVILID